MSKPHPKPYSITVFVVEGIQTATVVTTVAGTRSQRQQPFADPQAALTWCQTHHAMMVYTPSDPSRN